MLLAKNIILCASRKLPIAGDIVIKKNIIILPSLKINTYKYSIDMLQREGVVGRFFLSLKKKFYIIYRYQNKSPWTYISSLADDADQVLMVT